MTGPLKADVAGIATEVAEFEDFVRSSHKRLLAHASRRLGNDRSLAEDMVQEAYLRLWRAWPMKREPILTVARYSYQTLDNCIREYWRVKNNWPVTQSEAPTDEAVAAAEDEVVVRYAVRDAVVKLPSRIRQVIELNVIERLPMAEVAERMGIAVGTARNYKTAGMELLRGIIGG